MCGYQWYPGKTKTMLISKADCKDGNDKKLIKRIRALLNSADIVIGQNSDSFDLKILNTQMVTHRIPPPSPYRTIDTLKIARQRFAFQKNGLNDMGKLLSEGEKVKHLGFSMWTDFMAGSTDARTKMAKYCSADVDLTVKVYERMKPWIKNHPNMGIKEKGVHCPTCGYDSYQRRGTAYTKTMSYNQYRCNKCWSWFRGVRGERNPQVTGA